MIKEIIRSVTVKNQFTEARVEKIGLDMVLGKSLSCDIVEVGRIYSRLRTAVWFIYTHPWFKNLHGTTLKVGYFRSS